MNEFICPGCHQAFRIFSSKGGQHLATLQGINFLASIPIDPELGTCMESPSKSFAQSLQSSVSLNYIERISDAVILEAFH